jgi:polyhydroxyalkanoate synthesis regulator phasin
MKTLEQTLEELKQLEQLVSSGKELTEDEVKEIVSKLESSYDLAYGELEKMEEESLKTIQQDEE